MQATLFRANWLLVGVLLAQTTSHAQTFPAADRWFALRCPAEVMTDLEQDEAGARNEKDLVGTTSFPAGERASDGDYLYLRLRLDQDPIPNGLVRPFAWGLLLDVDGNLSTYEVLL